MCELKPYGLVFLILTVLCGCEATTFESIPKNATTECAVHWPGGWIGLDENGHDDPSFAVFVNSACDIENAAAENTAPTPAHAQFLKLHSHDYMVLSAADVRRLANVKDADVSIPVSGYFLMRWSIEKDRLALTSPDHKRVATLIVNGAFDGTVHHAQDGSLQNVISGAPEEIQSLLERVDFYSEQPFARLRWTGATHRSVEQAVAKAKHSQAAKAKS